MPLPTLAIRVRRRLNACPKGLFIMTLKLNVRGAILVAAAFTGLVALASPARADRCDDSAKELASQVDRLKVNFRAANVVYLTHPAAKELSVGCRGDKYSIELYAKGDRKPKPEFYALVGDRLNRDQGRHHDGRDALPEADGSTPRRQGHHALPPAQHGMHPHQDRGVHRHHARQGRIGAQLGRDGSPRTPSLRAQRNNQVCRRGESLDCFVARVPAMTGRYLCSYSHRVDEAEDDLSHRADSLTF